MFMLWSLMAAVATAVRDEQAFGTALSFQASGAIVSLSREENGNMTRAAQEGPTSGRRAALTSALWVSGIGRTIKRPAIERQPDEKPTKAGSNGRLKSASVIEEEQAQIDDGWLIYFGKAKASGLMIPYFHNTFSAVSRMSAPTIWVINNEASVPIGDRRVCSLDNDDKKWKQQNDEDLPFGWRARWEVAEAWKFNSRLTALPKGKLFYVSCLSGKKQYDWPKDNIMTLAGKTRGDSIVQKKGDVPKHEVFLLNGEGEDGAAALLRCGGPTVIRLWVSGKYVWKPTFDKKMRDPESMGLVEKGWENPEFQGGADSMCTIRDTLGGPAGSIFSKISCLTCKVVQITEWNKPTRKVNGTIIKGEWNIMFSNTMINELKKMRTQLYKVKGQARNQARAELRVIRQLLSRHFKIAEADLNCDGRRPRGQFTRGKVVDHVKHSRGIMNSTNKARRPPRKKPLPKNPTSNERVRLAERLVRQKEELTPKKNRSRQHLKAYLWTCTGVRKWNAKWKRFGTQPEAKPLTLVTPEELKIMEEHQSHFGNDNGLQWWDEQGYIATAQWTDNGRLKATQEQWFNNLNPQTLDVLKESQCLMLNNSSAPSLYHLVFDGAIQLEHHQQVLAGCEGPSLEYEGMDVARQLMFTKCTWQSNFVWTFEGVEKINQPEFSRMHRFGIGPGDRLTEDHMQTWVTSGRLVSHLLKTRWIASESLFKWTKKGVDSFSTIGANEGDYFTPQHAKADVKTSSEDYEARGFLTLQPTYRWTRRGAENRYMHKFFSKCPLAEGDVFNPKQFQLLRVSGKSLDTLLNKWRTDSLIVEEEPLRWTPGVNEWATNNFYASNKNHFGLNAWRIFFGVDGSPRQLVSIAQRTYLEEHDDLQLLEKQRLIVKAKLS